MEPAACGPLSPQDEEAACAPPASPELDALESVSGGEAFSVGSPSSQTSVVLGLQQHHVPSADTLGDQAACAVKASPAEYPAPAIHTAELAALEQSQSFFATCADEGTSVSTETQRGLAFARLPAEEACAHPTSDSAKRKSARGSSPLEKTTEVNSGDDGTRAAACSRPEIDAGAAKRQRRSQGGGPPCEPLPHFRVEVNSPTAAACIPSSAASQASGLPPAASRASSAFLSAEGGALEVEWLRVSVARLQQENQVLKEALKSRNACRTAAGGSAEPHSRGVPPPSETQGPLVTSTKEEAKSRKGRAPGAPPSSWGPHRRLQEKGVFPLLASGAEGSSPLNSSDSHLRRWGWCSHEEPLSSLRACCADHLLLEGECGLLSEESGSSECLGKAPCNAACLGKRELLKDAAARERAQVDWILSLEARVQATLKQTQEPQEDKSGPSSPKNALKRLIEEVGFSSQMI
ncbi:hypothetical protein ACSSS7_003674 [Eimeria intestinalis]